MILNALAFKKCSEIVLFSNFVDWSQKHVTLDPLLPALTRRHAGFDYLVNIWSNLIRYQIWWPRIRNKPPLRVEGKGGPGSESQTWGRLVSPAKRRKKKNEHSFNIF